MDGFATDWVGEQCSENDYLMPNEELKEQWLEACFAAWRESVGIWVT